MYYGGRPERAHPLTTWFVALWVAALAIPVLAFRHVVINGRGIGTQIFAALAIAVALGLFACDATGLVRVFPWEWRFYVTPIGEPARTPAPHTVRR